MADNKYTTECFFCHNIWGMCECPSVEPGFEWNGMAIHFPMLDETARQFVNPEVYYGRPYFEWKANRHPSLGHESFPISMKEVHWRTVLDVLEKEKKAVESCLEYLTDDNLSKSEEYHLDLQDIIRDIERQLLIGQGRL